MLVSFQILSLVFYIKRARQSLEVSRPNVSDLKLAMEKNMAFQSSFFAVKSETESKMKVVQGKRNQGQLRASAVHFQDRWCY